MSFSRSIQRVLVVIIAFGLSACADFGSQPGSIVFLGDSIIAQNDWASFLGADDIVNQGVVGDTIEDVHRRIDQTVKRQPRAVFILVGINNKPTPSRINSMLKAYDRLLGRLDNELAGADVFVLSLIPIHQELFAQHYSATEITNAHIEAFNLQLRELVRARGDVYIDLYPHLLSDSNLNIKWTHDGLHLNREGYRQWHLVLKQYIQPYLE